MLSEIVCHKCVVFMEYITYVHRRQFAKVGKWKTSFRKFSGPIKCKVSAKPYAGVFSDLSSLSTKPGIQFHQVKMSRNRPVF